MALDLPAVPSPVREDGGAAHPSLPPGHLGAWGSVLDLMAAALDSDTGPASSVGSEDPYPRAAQLVVFAADHPVARLRLSADPVAETARRAADLAAGRGTVAAAATAAGVGVRVVDVGIATRDADSGADAAVPGGSGRGSIDHADAMDESGLAAAIDAGRAAADAAVDAGADLLIGAVCGVGVTTPTAALTAAVTGMEPVDATGRGTGIDDSAWIRKAAAVRDALFRVRRAGTDVPTMLRVGGGPDLAALTGFVAQGAIRRTLVLIDDSPSSLCAVLAQRLAPGADAYVVASSLTPTRGHRRLLELLGREPMTQWLLTGGSGLGALLAVPALRAAWAVRLAAAIGPDVPREPYARDNWDPELL